jgi:DNA-binding transcriptional MerR regulator
LSQSGISKSSQAFRTIAEASQELDVPPHVLRFWEGKFTQIKPLKRAGGRRHYRPDDMALLRGIRALLQEDGYQLKGVQKLLKDQGIAWVRDRGQTTSNSPLDDGEINEPQIYLQERKLLEPANPPGPLFEVERVGSAAENISPAAGIVLRKALVKLEKARQILNDVAKNNMVRTNKL